MNPQGTHDKRFTSNFTNIAASENFGRTSKQQIRILT